MTPTVADLASPFVHSLLEEMEALREEVKELKRLIFGSKKERFIATPDQNQLSLELGTEPAASPLVVKQTVRYERIVKKLDRKPIQQPFPAHLPRVIVVIEPTEDVSGMHKIGEEITEELDLKPAYLFVRRYVRPRYVSREETFHIGPLPARVIEKGMPGAGLLAQIIGDKFVLHLPFYRQARRYEQLGMHIPASTINTWFELGCCLIEMIGEEQRKRVLSSTYLMVDETPIRVLDKQKKGKSHRGYFWVYYSPQQKLVWFDYQPGRGRKGQQNFCKILRAIYRRMAILYTKSLGSNLASRWWGVWPMFVENLNTPWQTINPEPRKYCSGCKSFMPWKERPERMR